MAEQDSTTPGAGVRQRRANDRAVIHAAIASALRAHHSVGLIHIDLDRFHLVNTRFGRAIGDEVLDALGSRLAQVVASDAVLAETDGDAFLIVLPGGDENSTRQRAAELLVEIAKPLTVPGGTVSLDASAGFSAAHGTATDHDLIEQAFLACRFAKNNAPGTVVGYAEELGADVARRQRLETGLRQALEQDELRLYLQPTVDLRDGRINGVEALLRWQHPTDGLLLPAEFLPFAEAAGLMNPIGDWVLDHALQIAARWRAEWPGRAPRLWINLASQQLDPRHRLIDRIEAALHRGDIRQEDIGFEVTESSLLEDVDSARQILASLRALDVQIALDDFGTGYSSLSYLRQLPVTAVKIDRLFISGIGDSLTAEAIVEAVIDLAHALDLRVIAEGIEDASQAEALIQMSADEAQGYFFSEPTTVEFVERLFGERWPLGGELARHEVDRRADLLPGFGSPRSRLLLTALDTARDAILVTTANDPTGDGTVIVYANEAFEKESGFRARDTLASSLDRLLEDPDGASSAWFAATFQSGQSATREVPSRRADGSTYVCEVALSPIVDQRGVHTHWLHVRRDLTERRIAEVELERFRRIVDHSSTFCLLADSTGTLLYMNDAYRRALGIPLDTPIQDIRWPWFSTTADRSLARDSVLPVIRRGDVWSDEAEFSNLQTGEKVEARFDVYLLDDPLRPGTQIFVCTGQDVTDLNRAAAFERRRSELADFAASVARQALRGDRAEVFASSFAVLEPMAGMFHADLAYLDIVDYETRELRPIGDWTSEHVESYSPPERVSFDRVPRWLHHLRTLSSPTGSTSSERSEPWVGELDAVFQISSGTNIYAPLRVGGALLGVVGLTRFVDRTPWTTIELNTFQQVADTLSALLGRLRADEALSRNVAHSGPFGPVSAAPADSQGWVRALLNDTNDVIVVVDDSGTVRFVNAAVERALGYRADELLGRNMAEVVHPEDVAHAAARIAAVFDGEPAEPTRLRIVGRDGQVGWWEISRGAVHEQIGGRVMICRDVNADVINEEQARYRLQLLTYALELSHSAVEHDAEPFVAGLHRICAEIAELLDVDDVFICHLDEGGGLNTHRAAGGTANAVAPQFDATALNELSTRLRQVEPIVVDDLELATEPWIGAYRQFFGDLRASVCAGITTSAGAIGVVAWWDRDRPRPWSEGEVTFARLIGETVANALERARVGEALRTSEALFRSLSEAAADTVLLVDNTGVIRYASPSAEELIGVSATALLGRRVEELVHPDDRAQFPTVASMPAMATTTTEVRLRRPDGRQVWVTNSSSALADPRTGQTTQLRMSLRDTTDRKRVEQELQHRALHDPLTGLANRHLMHARLVDALERAQDSTELVVLMVDLDRFKQVNDTFGHAVGDEVLRAVGRRLSAVVRPTDTVSRTGGDEFVVICPTADTSVATAIAGRIIDRLGAPITVNDQQVVLGASIGIAVHRGRGGKPLRILDVADRAMYQAKHSSTDRVVVATTDAPAAAHST